MNCSEKNLYSWSGKKYTSQKYTRHNLEHKTFMGDRGQK